MVRAVSLAVSLAALLAPVAHAGDARPTPPAAVKFQPSQGLYEDITRIIEAEIKANDKQHIGTPNPFMKPRARPSRLPHPEIPMG